MQFKSDVEAVDFFREKYKALRSEIGKVIVGQDEVVKDVLISIFSNGHCLLVGVPGLAKTLLVNTIAQIGRAHVLNSSHHSSSYAVFCLKKKNVYNAPTYGYPPPGAPPEYGAVNLY